MQSQVLSLKMVVYFLMGKGYYLSFEINFLKAMYKLEKMQILKSRIFGFQSWLFSLLPIRLSKSLKISELLFLYL